MKEIDYKEVEKTIREFNKDPEKERIIKEAFKKAKESNREILDALKIHVEDNNKLYDVLMDMQNSLEKTEVIAPNPTEGLYNTLDKHHNKFDRIAALCSTCYPEEKRLAYKILNVLGR